MSGWGIQLDSIYVGEALVPAPACTPIYPLAHVGCLEAPPDGLGMPDIAGEDYQLLSHDAFRMVRDRYGRRIITATAIVGSGMCAPGPVSVRTAVRDLVQAWSRVCDGTRELVIYTPDHLSGGDPASAGPFGVIGRPRGARVEWESVDRQIATVTLRFDAVDHRLYILDECGYPASGGSTLTLSPGSYETEGRTYESCPADGRCYDMECNTPSVSRGTLDNAGDLDVPLRIVLNGYLPSPSLRVGSSVITFDGEVFGAPVVIDTGTGTAMQGDADVTHLLRGASRLTVPPGPSDYRLTDAGWGNLGTAVVTVRPAVLSA